MYTAPEYFTKEEVAQIHQHAKTVPLDMGRTGHGQEDPDSPPENEEVGVNNEIRQSSFAISQMAPAVLQPAVRMPAHGSNGRQSLN